MIIKLEILNASFPTEGRLISLEADKKQIASEIKIDEEEGAVTIHGASFQVNEI